MFAFLRVCMIRGSAPQGMDLQEDVQQEQFEEGPQAPQPWQEAYYTLHLLGKIMKHCPREVSLYWAYSWALQQI